MYGGQTAFDRKRDLFTGRHWRSLIRHMYCCLWSITVISLLGNQPYCKAIYIYRFSLETIGNSSHQKIFSIGQSAFYFSNRYQLCATHIHDFFSYFFHLHSPRLSFYPHSKFSYIFFGFFIPTFHCGLIPAGELFKKPSGGYVELEEGWAWLNVKRVLDTDLLTGYMELEEGWTWLNVWRVLNTDLLTDPHALGGRAWLNVRRVLDTDLLTDL